MKEREREEGRESLNIFLVLTSGTVNNFSNVLKFSPHFKKYMCLFVDPKWTYRAYTCTHNNIRTMTQHYDIVHLLQIYYSSHLVNNVTKIMLRLSH